MTRPRILLTGASGVLGKVIAEHLAPHADVTCLVRKRRIDVHGVHQVPGDLTEHHLGLDARVLRNLEAHTDVVLHCGAATGFGSDPRVPERVNVEGTRRVLDLATRARARLVHVSTAFVARLGEFEAVESGDLRSPAAYLRSKVAAEAAVAGSGLDAVVVRPSVLMGDSMTGEITSFQGWHTVCGEIITGQMPFLPAEGRVLVDTVPVDRAARAIAGLALEAPTDRREWWLTAGTQALTLAESVDACMAVAAESGLAPHRPRALPREMVERLVLPAFAAEAPRVLRRRMLEGIEMMRLFAADDAFPCAWPEGHPAPERSDLARWATTSLRYWYDATAGSGDSGAAEGVA
jgi:nucleoside-diphosphate-sugar epimerase